MPNGRCPIVDKMQIDSRRPKVRRRRRWHRPGGRRDARVVNLGRILHFDHPVTIQLDEMSRWGCRRRCRRRLVKIRWFVMILRRRRHGNGRRRLGFLQDVIDTERFGRHFSPPLGSNDGRWQDLNIQMNWSTHSTVTECSTDATNRMMQLIKNKEENELDVVLSPVAYFRREQNEIFKSALQGHALTCYWRAAIIQLPLPDTDKWQLIVFAFGCIQFVCLQCVDCRGHR